jgi:hypothetical protein
VLVFTPFLHSVAQSQENTPTWQKIEPGGATVCARGTPYAYWTHEGASDDLLIYFEPGGGCWSADTCAVGSGFFDDNVIDREDSPAYQDGIFNFENADNPFKAYDMVYVSYCTGDVHMGSNTQTYSNASTTLTIEHQGFTNASTVLEWVYENHPEPDSVFITGCSAGSVGSAFHAPYIIEQYPDTRIAQLGDSLSFTYHRPLNMQTDYHAHDNFPMWIEALQEMEVGNFTMSGYISAVANAYPDIIFSEYNTQHDRVQVSFYRAVGGKDENWVKDFEANIGAIQDAAPNFRSFTAGGDSHCILPLARFYTYGVEGVSFRAWIDALAKGEAVESLHCDDCSEPEIIE